MQVLVNVFGFLGVFCTLFIYVQKKRKNLLTWKFACDCFWLVHYILIGASSAVAATVAALLRTFVFMNIKGKGASGKAWLYLFLAVSVLFSILGWEGPISILVLVASISFTVAFWVNDPKVTRMITIPSVLFYLIYYIIVGSVPAIICEVFIFVSSMVGFLKNDCKKENLSS